MKKLLLLSLLVLFGCSKDSEGESANTDFNFFEKVDGKIFIPTSPNIVEEHDDFYVVLVKFAESWQMDGRKGTSVIDARPGMLKKNLYHFKDDPELTWGCEVQLGSEHRNDYTVEEIIGGVKFTRGSSTIEATLTSFSFPLKVSLRLYEGQTYTYMEVNEDDARNIAEGLSCTQGRGSFNIFFDY